MFHRPKTEDQNEQDAKVKTPASKASDVVEQEPKQAEPSQETQDKVEEPKVEPSAPASSYAQGLAKWTSSEKTSNDDNDKNSKVISEDKNMTNDQQDTANRQIDIPGNAQFQSRPGTFAGGAYPGSSSSSSTSEGRRLVISEGITMSGEITACDYLVIEGTVEAALQGARVMEVSETGTFYGTVEIDEATIAGRFEGEIICNGRLTIKSSGSVTGSISYRELQVEAGAEIDGKLGPLKTAAASNAKSSPAKSAEKKASSAKNDNQGSEELPLSDAVAAE